MRRAGINRHVCGADVKIWQAGDEVGVVETAGKSDAVVEQAVYPGRADPLGHHAGSGDPDRAFGPDRGFGPGPGAQASGRAGGGRGRGAAGEAELV